MRTRSGLIFIAAILFAAVALWAWFVFTGDDFTGEKGPPSEPVAVPTFVDVSLEAGVVFQHESGARGQKYNPETFGPGAGWIDYDGDDRLDLLLVNGNRLEGPRESGIVSRLLRNTGDGRFEDVTAAAGLAVPLYGMGFPPFERISGSISAFRARIWIPSRSGPCWKGSPTRP